MNHFEDPKGLGEKRHKLKPSLPSYVIVYYYKGTFFWDYSGIGILGIDGICVLLGAIPFLEWTEYHSVRSAPESRMNRMEGMWCTRSFGKFLAEKANAAACAGRVCRYSSSQATSDSVSRSEICRSVLFKIEILCILLFLNRNKNSQISPKRMHPKFKVSW